MAFKQAYSNTKNILADFVTSLCYEQSDDNLQENWQLIYPKQQDLVNFLDYLSNKETIDEEDQKFLSYTSLDIKDDMNKRRDLVFRWIVEYRRSTVSCMYLPELQWERSERVGITPEMLTADSNEQLFIKLKKPLDSNASIGVYLQDKKIWFYQNNELSTLSNVEFYPDYKNNGLIINKSNISFKGTNIIYLNINYQTYGEEPITWYVDFDYPLTLDGKRKNYHYFEWTFGKEIDSNHHIVNRKKKPISIRGCWHTSAVLDRNVESQDLSWLPIEYFMSWDLNSVSFVLCEDPIVEVNRIIHSFNYIGVLEGIKDADYDDIDGNFGSCGSYDVRVQSTQGNPVSKNITLERANITFVRKIYNSHFNLSEAQILLQLKNVNAGNYTVEEEMINDLPDFDSANLQISDGQTNIIKTLQLKAGDVVRSCSPTYNPLSMDSEQKAVGLVANSITKRYNIFKRTGKKGMISLSLGSDFEINIGTSAAPVYVSAKLLSNDNKFSMVNGQLVTLTTINNDIYLARDTNATNSLGLPVILDAGMNIGVKTKLAIPYTDNQPLKLPTGTIVVDLRSQELYKLTSDSFISVNKLILELTSPINLTVEKETEFDISNPVPVGSVVKLKTTYLEITFDIITDYIVEFHYRTPFVGNIQYYFPSIWFDGLSISKGSRTGVLTNVNSALHESGNYLSNTTGTWQGGTTPLVIPIIEESMKKNAIGEVDSMFNNVVNIDEVNIPGLTGKNDAIPVVQTSSHHKVKITVSDIITNTDTGESWKLENVSITPNSAAEQTTNSLTNIIMYPRQVYTSDFRYRKRTGNKATITLGEFDSTRLGLYLIDSSNKILVDYDGAQTYNNISVIRNSDNGVSLDIDTNNLTSEIVYLGIYRYDLYFTQQTDRDWPSYNSTIEFDNMNIDISFDYNISNKELISKLNNIVKIITVPTSSITNPEIRENLFYNNIPYKTTNIQKPIVGTVIDTLKILEINLNNKDFVFKPVVFARTATLKHLWQ